MSPAPSRHYFSVPAPSTTYTRHKQVVSLENDNTWWTEIEALRAAQKDTSSKAPMVYACSNPLLVPLSIIEGTVVEVIRLSDMKPAPNYSIMRLGGYGNSLHTSKITIVSRKAGTASASLEPDSYFVTEHRCYHYATSRNTGHSNARTTLTWVHPHDLTRFKIWFEKPDTDMEHRVIESPHNMPLTVRLTETGGVSWDDESETKVMHSAETEPSADGQSLNHTLVSFERPPSPGRTSRFKRWLTELRSRKGGDDE